MSRTSLDALLNRISDGGLLDDPVAEGGIVHGRASLDAAGADVIVTVDAEFDDEDADVDALIDGVTRILAVNERTWRAVIDAVAEEIEETGDDAEVIEQVDLRDDLEARSVVVFADAFLITLAAPRQFPDSRILVQLDEDLEVDSIEVDQVDVSTVDDPRDHVNDSDDS